MENNQIKIRINLEQREFEVQGDVKYINEKFGAYIDECLDIVKSYQKETKATKPKNEHKEDIGLATSDTMPDSFGEYLNGFPKNIGNVDKLLVAGFYLQSKNQNNFFTVLDASNILVDQGVKLSNASAFNTSNIATKRVFKLSGRNFRVSDIGVQYLKTL